MKSKKYYWLAALAVIVLIILVIIFYAKKKEYSFKLEYVGEVTTSVEKSDFSLCYIINDGLKDRHYPLHRVLYHKRIYELQNEFEVDIDIEFNRRKYYICSYGRKIKDMQILFMYDEEIFNDFYYGKVEYEDGFSEDKLFFYEVNNVNVSFIEMKTMETFGTRNQIQLVERYGDSIDLLILRKGTINSLLENEHESRVDVTTETKVYYYKKDGIYLYTINKWGRHTVIDTDSNSIVARTYNIEDMPDKHRDIFKDINSFIDISYVDKYPKNNSIEFGDGTIYIKDIGQRGYYIIFNEKEHIYIDGDKSIMHDVIKYKQDGSLLYAVDDDCSLIILDVDSYNILYSGNSGELPEEYKTVFEEESGFIILDDGE